MNVKLIAGQNYIQHFPVTGELKAYALVVHGLNNKPSIMQAIIERLNATGVYVLNVCLAGHSDAVKNYAEKKCLLHEFKKATREIWQEQIRNAIMVLNDIKQSKPSYLIGYSAGAVLSLELIHRHCIAFDKFVLFAPAISFRSAHRLLHYIPFKKMLIPSFLDEAYCSNRSTPLSAYNAIIETSRECHKNAIQTCLNRPSLVIMDPKDEMLSIKGMRQFIADKQLSKWRLLSIDGGAGRGNYHHLVTSNNFVGEDNWRLIWTEIDSLLKTT